MLNILAIISQALGYFNVNSVFKNKIATAIGSVANFYLLYLAINYLKATAKFHFRGWLFLILFLILLYFSILNVIFYFTKKTAKFDISPKIESLLSEHKEEETEKVEKQQKILKGMNIPSAGLFNEANIMPGKLKITPNHQKNIEKLVDELVAKGFLSLNYAGLNDDEINANAQAISTPFYAIGQAVLLPYYDLRKEAGRLVVHAGMNALDEQAVGELVTVGLTEITDLKDKYDLVIAKSYLAGGPYKIAGRTGVKEGSVPFSVVVQVAYREKETTKPDRVDSKNK